MVLECANLLALYYSYQSGDKSPHSKETTNRYLSSSSGESSIVTLLRGLGTCIDVCTTFG